MSPQVSAPAAGSTTGAASALAAVAPDGTPSTQGAGDAFAALMSMMLGLGATAAQPAGVPGEVAVEPAVVGEDEGADGETTAETTEATPETGSPAAPAAPLAAADALLLLAIGGLTSGVAPVSPASPAVPLAKTAGSAVVAAADPAPSDAPADVPADATAVPTPAESTVAETAAPTSGQQTVDSDAAPTADQPADQPTAATPEAETVTPAAATATPAADSRATVAGEPAPGAGPTATAAAAPATAPPATAATPADDAAPARAVAAQVVPEVARLATRGDGTHRLTLELNPRALGEVRVVMTVRDGAVQVRLAAGDRARDLLTHSAGDLVRALERAGFEEHRIVLATSGDAAAASVVRERGDDDRAAHEGFHDQLQQHRRGGDTQHDEHDHHSGKGVGSSSTATEGSPVRSTVAEATVPSSPLEAHGVRRALDVRM